ncbi:hypothetical protein [Salinigranum salinum]|uniref:hypothetical protein n=1 Tax=Salinigranum salinum TaxID=1364937 RepID=UPI001260599F|nr:hypothetical protein [Salinigranum salinum]
MSSKRKYPLRRYVVYYSLIPGLLLFDWAVFRYVLGMDYVAWYLANGALIAIGTAFVSKAWSSVEQLSLPLVSADPVSYFGGCADALAMHMYAFSAAELARKPTDSWWEAHLDRVARPLDSLLKSVWILILTAIILGWFLFVAPANYLVTLVAGAPARARLRSPDHGVVGVIEPANVRRRGETFPNWEELAVTDIGSKQLYVYNVGTAEENAPEWAKMNVPTYEERQQLKRMEGDFHDFTFARDPFATTQALAGLVVFVAGALV